MRDGNLGAIPLRRHGRQSDPMAAFDALPPPLRRWLAQAALPWSPASCRHLWHKARRAGASVDEALTSLSRAEARILARLSVHEQQAVTLRQVK